MAGTRRAAAAALLSIVLVAAGASCTSRPLRTSEAGTPAQPHAGGLTKAKSPAAQPSSAGPVSGGTSAKATPTEDARIPVQEETAHRATSTQTQVADAQTQTEKEGSAAAGGSASPRSAEPDGTSVLNSASHRRTANERPVASRAHNLGWLGLLGLAGLAGLLGKRAYRRTVPDPYRGVRIYETPGT